MATKRTRKPSEKKSAERRTGLCIKVGEMVAIRTVTHAMVGKVTSVEQMPFPHCVLTTAAWIGDSGRWGEFLEKGETEQMEVEVEPHDVTVALDAIVDARFWQHGPFTETV